MNVDAGAICHLHNNDIIRADNERVSFFSKVHQRDHGDRGNLVYVNFRFRVNVDWGTMDLDGNDVIRPSVLGLFILVDKYGITIVEL